MKNRLYGILFSTFLSVIIVIIFFGNILRNLNNTYFSTGGDGFKSYYGALYHVKHDSVMFRTNAMNYPFGELTTFTDSQPLVTNAVRFLNREFSDIADYIVGIMNGLMLLSFILGAVFIFLIFYEVKTVWWYGALAAAGISMLSPQIARLGGHYSLSWLVWIPAMVYWLIRFDRARSLHYTFLIGLTTFLSGKMHLYYLGFCGFLIAGYWIRRFLCYRRTNTIWYRDVLNIFLQYILPVILIQLSMVFHDNVADRTAYPYGFGIYLGHPAAVFLPSGQPWAFVPKVVTVFNHISWESLAYVGIAALAGFIFAIGMFIPGLIKKQGRGSPEDTAPLNLYFWISVIALLFSFGIPFIFGLESLVDHLGPVRQLRALGRFAWLFYYMLNIVVFAALSRRAFLKPASLSWKLAAGVAILMLIFEGYWNMKGNTSKLNNRIPELEDRQNLTDGNRWVNRIDPGDYQAIIPVPYFHTGSENIWIDGGHRSKETTMLASLKTGLPTTGVELSRTSISQTFLNYTLFTEPLHRIELVDYLSSEKPFLVLLMNSYDPAPAEKWLLKGAVTVTGTENFTLMSLPVGHIKRLHETWRLKAFEDFKNAGLFRRDGMLVSDSSSFFLPVTFDQLPSATAFRGPGAFTFPSQKWARVYTDTLTNIPKGKNLVIGFWIYHYQNDAFLRANVELTRKNPVSGEITDYFYSDMFRHLKAFQDDWALVEIEIETKSDDEIIELSVRNTVLPRTEFVLDELLVREKETDVWDSDQKYLYRNGRRYLKR